MPEKLYNKLDIQKIIEGFTPKSTDLIGLSKNEVMLTSLEILAFIFEQDLIWDDEQSSEMIRGNGLKYIATKIIKENEVGQGCALQCLCLITRFRALIPEFLNLNVMPAILRLLHSFDPKIRLYCAEIIKNFSITEKLLDYVDKLDLLRNLIDSFYSNDSFKLVSLLLDCFINVSDFPVMRLALMSTELSDKVCWLLTRKDENYKDIRQKSLSLLVTLISEETFERVIKNLKGKIKILVTERDAKIVFSSLLVLKRILEFDKTNKIVDFELIQSLIMNLGHIENNIFNETMEILTYLRVLDDDTYIKVMFTMDGIIRLLDIFPTLNDLAKINFCLAVFY